MSQTFDAYRPRAWQVICDLAKQWERDALDEQAVPAYTRGNVFSRQLFWKRLEIVARALENGVRNRLPERPEGCCAQTVPDTVFQGGTCLDFGCGSGVMLPFLQQRFGRVIGVDIMPDFAKKFLDHMAGAGQQPRGIQLHSSLDDAALAPGSVDVILALDVLEHVDKLDELVQRLAGLLTPTGRLIVSGPTENFLYRLGRKIVGFSGHYHHRNVYDIEASMARCLQITRLCSIPWFCPLFLLLQAEKGSDTVCAQHPSGPSGKRCLAPFSPRRK